MANCPFQKLAKKGKNFRPPEAEIWPGPTGVSIEGGAGLEHACSPTAPFWTKLSHQTGEDSSFDFKKRPVMDFLSGAIPVMDPVTDLHRGLGGNSVPERASAFSVAGEAPRFSKGDQSWIS